MTLSKEQKVVLREKEAQVLELRKAGMTFTAIAQSLDYADASGVKRAYDRAMQATIQQPADEIRHLELERLDALTKALWPAALKGNTQAISQCLSIMDRRAKLLGLDMPTRSHVTVITRDATEAAIAELEAQLAAHDAHTARSGSTPRPAPVPPRPAGQG